MLRLYMKSLQVPILDFLSKKMATNLYVFSLFMEDRVGYNV